MRPALPLRGVAEAIREGTALLTASVGTGLALWTIDVLTWPSVRRPWPLFLSLALSLANGAAVGLAILAWWLPSKLVPTTWRWLLGLGVASLLVALGLGQALGVATVSTWRLPAAPCAAAVIVVLAWGWSLVVADADARSTSRARIATALLATVSAMLLVLDRTLLSAIVEKRYSFVEGLAVLSLTLASGLFLSGQSRARRRLQRVMPIVSLAAIGWTVVFVASPRVRGAIERALPAVWEEPFYAARWLRRARSLESRVDAPSALERVAARYELRSRATVDPRWNTPARGPGEGRGLLGSDQPWNVAVFFVDTLRIDVAEDPEVMPETARWLSRSFTFSRAYSTGSSTVLSLAPLLGCRYDAATETAPKLLEAARAASLQTSMVIPKSAHDYHREAFPGLHFDHEDVIPDIDGPRRTVAASVVDRSLGWLREARPERFFLWLYQYDVHGWPDLDEAWVEDRARRGGFSKEVGLHWRYRAAAHGVDEAFGRFLRGLDELGVADRTVVVFVADHGEALGQNAYWAHSTFLWESLIRVPLGIAVPGASGERIAAPVSTIDLGTTLVSMLGGGAAADCCHGEHLFGDGGKRRLPILFSSMIDGRLARVGILGERGRKAVVDLRDADARLLRVDDVLVTTESDVSSDEPLELRALLEPLVRAPIVPPGFR